MSTRLVQAGRGDVRPVLVAYHYDGLSEAGRGDRVMRDALGPAPCVINVTELPFHQNYRTVGQGQTARLAPLAEVLAWAVKKSGGGWTPGPVALLGFSEGCQAVRAHLKDGVSPAAIVLVDGSHASLPPSKDFEFGLYRAVFDQAVKGEGQTFIASHSDIRTDLIRPNPYMPTKAVLEEVTGWALDGGKVKSPAITRAGDAVVYSCAGGTASDHVFQCRDVLPRLLRDELARSAWAGLVIPSDDTAPPPPPVEPPPPPMTEELPAVRTPVSPGDVARALVSAWYALFGSPPPRRESIAILLAQWALETGKGRSMWCFNLGNAKSRPGDGRSWTFYACNEVLSPAQAAHYVATAQPRTGGKTGPNAVATSATVVWFYPSHPACRFRAFHTLDEGAVDYLGMLNKRFAGAWPAVVSGDPAAFSHALKLQGYYTASETLYTRGVLALFAEMMKVDFDISDELPHPDTDAGTSLSEDDRERTLALVAATYHDLAADLMDEDLARYETADEPDPA